MRYARVANGIVVEVMDVPDDGPPIGDLYHPDFAANCRVVSNGSVAEGWGWDGETFTAPAGRSLATVQAARKAAAQAAFAARIALGMPWGDAAVQIDDASQGRISAAVLMAQYGLPDGFTWRMADNSAVPMDAVALVAMARAAGAYVTALRMRYWQIVDAIAAAADAEAVAAVEVDTGWPTASSPAPAEG